MAQINLLPWREERRQELKKQFLITTVLFIAMGAGLVLLADRTVNGQIDNQNARNQYIKENIKVLDKQVAEMHAQFAAIHPQGWVAMPALMGLATGMTLVREWRGTLVPSMVIHGLSNALVMSMLWILLAV